MESVAHADELIESAVSEPASQIRSQTKRRRGRLWLIGTAIVAAVFLVVLLPSALNLFGVPLGPPIGYSTNVTIALRYVADDGRTYACTYDYSTRDEAPMPPSVARQMNERDWSGVGQLVYDWAKSHPTDSSDRELSADDAHRADAAATWSVAMDRYIVFPHWSVQTESGSGYELRTQARPNSNCEEGLRNAQER